jgi:hypothetical protein
MVRITLFILVTLLQLSVSSRRSPVYSGLFRTETSPQPWPHPAPSRIFSRQYRVSERATRLRGSPVPYSIMVSCACMYCVTDLARDRAPVFDRVPNRSFSLTHSLPPSPSLFPTAGNPPVFMADGGFKDRLGEGSAVQGRAKMK